VSHLFQWNTQHSSCNKHFAVGDESTINGSLARRWKPSVIVIFSHFSSW